LVSVIPKIKVKAAKPSLSTNELNLTLLRKIPLGQVNLAAFHKYLFSFLKVLLNFADLKKFLKLEIKPRFQFLYRNISPQFCAAFFNAFCKTVFLSTFTNHKAALAFTSIFTVSKTNLNI